MLRHHRRRLGQQNAIGVDEANLRTLTKKGDRLALHHRDANLIGQQPHYGCMLDPGNLLELLAAFAERHKENVAANIFTEDRQHLCAAHLLPGLWPECCWCPQCGSAHRDRENS